MPFSSISLSASKWLGPAIAAPFTVAIEAAVRQLAVEFRPYVNFGSPALAVGGVVLRSMVSIAAVNLRADQVTPG